MIQKYYKRSACGGVLGTLTLSRESVPNLTCVWRQRHIQWAKPRFWKWR